MIVTPNRNKVLILVIVFLLLANIGLAVLMFVGKGEKKIRGRKDQMTEYLKKDLGYSQEQIAVYDSLHQAYEKKLDSQMEAMRGNRKERFRILVESDFSDSAIKKASTEMASQQAESEMKMLQHLRNIRNIGSPGQRAKFDSTFFTKMARKKKMKR